MPHSFTKEEQARLRYWIQRQKAVQVGFTLLKESNNFQLLNPELIFAAGASFTFDMMIFMLDEGEMDTETDVRLMTKLHDELIEWDQKLRQIIVSPTPHQDKPS